MTYIAQDSEPQHPSSAERPEPRAPRIRIPMPRSLKWMSAGCIVGGVAALITLFGAWSAVLEWLSSKGI